tara:strand:- start:148 stop:273 length:126 start_codon:yes stop_codon:yes gene_type:complete
MTTTSYDCECGNCGKEITVDLYGGYLWDGEFACIECVEELE